MKKILLLLALISQVAFADNCKINHASQMVSKQTVGEVTDLDKDISPGKCVVRYRININNDWHTVTWTHSGPEQGEILCNAAIENGRKQLMTQLGGVYETESMTVCKQDGTLKFRPVKVGDEIMETEVGRVPETKKYFKHNNAVCRMFREKYNNGVLRINHGIICQADNGLWTVVDKW